MGVLDAAEARAGAGVASQSMAARVPTSLIYLLLLRVTSKPSYSHDRDRLINTYTRTYTYLRRYIYVLRVERNLKNERALGSATATAHVHTLSLLLLVYLYV